MASNHRIKLGFMAATENFLPFLGLYDKYSPTTTYTQLSAVPGKAALSHTVQGPFPAFPPLVPVCVFSEQSKRG